MRRLACLALLPQTWSLCATAAFAFPALLGPPTDPPLRFHPLANGDHQSLAAAPSRSMALDGSTCAAAYSLDFDSADGSLRIKTRKDGLTTRTRLLDGLPPKSWSAAPPSSVAGGSRAPKSRGDLFLRSHIAKRAASFETSLGRLATRRFLACARITRYWMGPKFGSDAGDVPLDTQFLLLEAEDGGPYALFLPLLDGDFRASLHGDRGGRLVCHQESGDDAALASGTRALYVGVDDDPYRLLRESFAAVARETGTFATLDEKGVPPHVDDFGWCTWDAFYSDVTPQGVIDGVTSLRKAGIQPRMVILDDGWQMVEPMKKQSADNDDAQLARSLSSKVANVLLGLLSRVVAAMYEKFVRRAPHNSWPNRIWRFLTRSVLRVQLWGYFDGETDFARQLSSFWPNDKFRKKEGASAMDLAELASRLKRELGVARLYCWHALHGYWRGVAPALGKKNGFNVTNVMPVLSKHLLGVEPVLAWDAVSLFGVGLVSDERDAAKLYDELHSPLVEAGVDGVKVDVQSGVASLGGGIGGGSRIARVYTEALEDSVSARFAPNGGAPGCINCMCHSTENLYRYRRTSVARASDDFYPDRPDSHAVHLVNVAYNSLFLGEVCLPDPDMFHSDHPSGALHAAFRAVSGGPVCISDPPERHDAALLRRMALEDGSVLRCLRPGRPTRDRLFADVGRDGVSVLKVWNENRAGGVVGLFHCQGVAWNFGTRENEVVDGAPPALAASTRPNDAESLRDAEGPFVAYCHRNSSIEYLADGESEVRMELATREWEIVTMVTVDQSNGIAWAPIGLANMLNSGGAVYEVAGVAESRPPSATFVSRGPGIFVAYCRPRPSMVSLDDKNTPMDNLQYTYDHHSGLLSFDLPSEKGSLHRVKVAWEGL